MSVARLLEIVCVCDKLALLVLFCFTYRDGYVGFLMLGCMGIDDHVRVVWSTGVVLWSFQDDVRCGEDDVGV